MDITIIDVDIPRKPQYLRISVTIIVPLSAGALDSRRIVLYKGHVGIELRNLSRNAIGIVHLAIPFARKHLCFIKCGKTVVLIATAIIVAAVIVVIIIPTVPSTVVAIPPRISIIPIGIIARGESQWHNRYREQNHIFFHLVHDSLLILFDK